jgi:hypothetical protein
VEHENDIAVALIGTRGEKPSRRNFAGTHHVAVAVLEVFAVEEPLLSFGHGTLLSPDEAYSKTYAITDLSKVKFCRWTTERSLVDVTSARMLA